MQVDAATELTIPHMAEYRLCRFPVECACPQDNDECHIRQFNRTLPPPPAIPATPKVYL